jgi:hypothetical protein
MSNEREALRAAIAKRDELDLADAAVGRARERAAQDRRRAFNEVEDAETRLKEARETARAALVDAYVGDSDDPPDTSVADAEAALKRAKARLDDMVQVSQGLEAHKAAPGRSVPAIKVEQAVKAVVLAHPTVRRLAADYRIAEQTFHQYHSTLRWLAGKGMIPADLCDAAPKGHDTFFAPPDPDWVSAVEALSRDPDFDLPQ